jgi:hypothetical protein
MDIRPGLNIRVVTEVDLLKETIHVGSAVIYDMDGSTLTISQTDPPILKSMLGREIEITYLAREKNELVRFGFPARIKEFVDQYPLNPSQKVKALIVAKEERENPYNLPMFYRVEPTSKSRLAMTVSGEPVNILDISLGGARLSFPKTFVLDPNSFHEASLHIDSTVYSVRIRIVRTWDGSAEGFSQELRFAAIEFLHSDGNLGGILSRKIREIEVEPMREESQRLTDGRKG